MQNYWCYLSEFLKIVTQEDIEAYLVGGFIRDLYIKKNVKDIDIVLKERVAEIARYFADINNGYFVILDDNRSIYRVIIKNISFDFVKMIGSSIEEDLSRRDFTINAIALSLNGDMDNEVINFLQSINEMPLKDIRKSGLLIDPYSGLGDLKNKKISIIKSNVFKEDPLRLWRAIRLKRHLSFDISIETIKTMKEDRNLAAEPAVERIREELVKIFSGDKVSSIVEYMEDCFSLLSKLIPDIIEMKKIGENQYHQEDAWSHCVLVLKMLEKYLSNEKYYKLLDEENIYLLKISALLHDIGKIKTRIIKNKKVHYYGHEYKGSEMLASTLKKLKFSNFEISYIRKVIRYHMRPMMLYIADNLTDKGRFRFFKQVGTMTPAVLIHSLADKTAGMLVNQRHEEIAVYQKFINNLLELYGEYRDRTASLYLNGREIIKELSIQEGPYIGKLLDKLTEAQAEEEVRNKEEAVKYLKNIIQKDLKL
ncbi:MAG: CCA tRNA nucleotidyltransferase [Halanaerobiaceae bacterium]